MASGECPAPVAKRFRILIVDDQVEILRALQRELRDIPADIDTCNNGKDALEALQRQRYALLITDNSMPGMTGIELLGHLDKISPETSRIVLSGFTNLDSALEKSASGVATYYLEKPWKRAELQQQVVRALEEFRLRADNHDLAEQLQEREERLTSTRGSLNRLASRDPATELFNREELQSALERQIKLCRRDRQPF
jgi:DNA-binding NtrC family response regulator